MARHNQWIARIVVLVMVASAGAAFVAASGPAVDDPAQPDAACRIMPECWVDSDCDTQCGAGLGRCAHSKCPIRICRCR